MKFSLLSPSMVLDCTTTLPGPSRGNMRASTPSTAAGSATGAELSVGVATSEAAGAAVVGAASAAAGLPASAMAAWAAANRLDEQGLGRLLADQAKLAQLARHLTPAGALTTFAEAGPIRVFTRLQGQSFAGWCGPHTCVTAAGAGFDVDTNVVTLVDASGATSLPMLDKDDVAAATTPEPAIEIIATMATSISSEPSNV